MKSDVNPELGEYDTLLLAAAMTVPLRADVWTTAQRTAINESAERVGRLFDVADATIRKAVAGFLAKDPGELDHILLRIVAIAAPLLGDSNQVANLIADIPLTRMGIAAPLIDIASTRELLMRSFGADTASGQLELRWSPATRRKLVADLLRQTAWEVLSNAPPEHITPEGVVWLQKRLTKQMSGSFEDQAFALESPYATPAMFRRALRNVENRLERIEAQQAEWMERGGSAFIAMGLAHWTIGATLDSSDRDVQRRGLAAEKLGRQALTEAPQLPPALGLGAIYSIVKSTLTNEAAKLRPDEIEQLWKIVERCTLSPPRTLHLTLNLFAVRPDLPESVALGMLRVLEKQTQLSSEQKVDQQKSNVCADMLGQSGLSESAAREIVRVMRKRGWLSALGGSLSVDSNRDPRLFALRFYHYGESRQTRLLQPDLSSEDIDRAVCGLPVVFLTGLVVYRMEDPRALARLTSRNDLPAHVMDAVARNRNLPPRVLAGLLREHRLSTRSVLFPKAARPGVDGVLANPVVTDTQLARTLGGSVLGGNGQGRRPLRLPGASHPALGPKFVAMLADEPDEPDELNDLAMLAGNASSVEALEAVAQYADRSPEIAGYLYLNLMTPQRVIDALIDGGFEPASGVAFAANWTSLEDDAIVDFVASNRARPELVKDILLEISKPGGVRHEKALGIVRQFADRSLLHASEWQMLTGSRSPNVALWFATHRNCPRYATTYRPAAQVLIAQTVDALDRGLGVLPVSETGLNSWYLLPGIQDEPFAKSVFGEWVDGQIVDGMTIHLLKTPRQLADLGKEMGNCLGHKLYRDEARLQLRILAVARGADGPYIVEWHARRGQIFAVKSDSRMNLALVSPRFRSGVKRMADQSGELTMSISEAQLAGREPMPRVSALRWEAATPRIFGSQTKLGAFAAVHSELRAGFRDVPNVAGLVKQLSTCEGRDRRLIPPVVNPPEVEALIEGALRHVHRIGEAFGREYAFELTYVRRRELADVLGTFEPADREAESTFLTNALKSVRQLGDQEDANLRTRIEHVLQADPGFKSPVVIDELVAGARTGAVEYLAKFPPPPGEEFEGSHREAVFEWLLAMRGLGLRSNSGPVPVGPAVDAATEVLGLTSEVERKQYLQTRRGPDDGPERGGTAGRSPGPPRGTGGLGGQRPAPEVPPAHGSVASRWQQLLQAGRAARGLIDPTDGARHVRAALSRSDAGARPSEERAVDVRAIGQQRPAEASALPVASGAPTHLPQGNVVVVTDGGDVRRKTPARHLHGEQPVRPAHVSATRVLQVPGGVPAQPTTESPSLPPVEDKKQPTPAIVIEPADTTKSRDQPVAPAPGMVR